MKFQLIVSNAFSMSSFMMNPFTLETLQKSIASFAIRIAAGICQLLTKAIWFSAIVSSRVSFNLVAKVFPIILYRNVVRLIGLYLRFLCTCFSCQ